LTGQFTALVSAANAPGFKFGSAHGAEFVADTGQAAHQGNDASVLVGNDGFVFATGGNRGSIGTNDDPSFGRQGTLRADMFSHLSADAPPAGHGVDVHEDVSSIHNPALGLHAFHLV
jgi:hypothetical protein